MQSNKIPLTGSYHQGNYIWAIAMNLAWNDLIANQLGGEARVESSDPQVNRLVDQFNTGIFNRELLEAAAYFVRSGIGPEALEEARADLQREKNITNSLLNNIDLLPGELFSYSRMEKMLTWMMDFNRCVGEFMGQKVEAFRPGSGSIRGVQVLEYHPMQPEKAVVRLYTNDGKDEVYLMGGYAPGREAEMVARINPDEWEREWPESLNHRDTLIIPAVNLTASRAYTELIGCQLINPQLPNVFISKMEEEIKLSMNHKGVEFIAEAIMMASRGMPPKPKSIVFDQPFLVVLKQTNQRLPYLVVGVNNVAILNIEDSFRHY